MTKKTRGPSGPSVLPRAAQDDKPRPKRSSDRDSKPARSSSGPRSGAGPRTSAGPRSSSGPRTGSGPRREGGFKREGSYTRTEGPRSSGPRSSAGPRTGTRPGASSGPRSSSGPRTGTGSRPSSGPRTSSGPRREGGFKREGSYTRTDGPRSSGPRSSSGPRTGTGYRPSSGPRTTAGPRTGSGQRTSSGPRREGGFKREGAYTRTDAPRTGTGPRREGSAPRSSGSSRYTGPQVPRDARGPRSRPTEATGKRHARPTRFDAATGKPIAADDRGARTGVKERPRSVGSAPAATAPRRGPNVRDLALQVLFQVQVKRAFAERVIDDLAEQFRLDQRDRGFLNELVKGTLRRRGTLDWHLNRLLHVGLSSLPLWIQNGLRLGAYQMIYLDRIPPRAAVDEAVKLALKYGHPGTAGLSNSVLRRLADEVGTRELPSPAAYKADGTPDLDGITALTSHPRWLVERWLARYGVEETLALCEANNRTAALMLRANRLRLDQKELIKRLEAAGLHADAGRWSSVSVAIESDADFSNFPSYARGDCTVQDESETMVGVLLGAHSGERVLDLCAAPGGKSTHMAELMGDVGEIIALEKMPPRARSMQRQIERLGLRSITVEVGDGTETDLLALGKGGPYDRAIVDAPCSSLGVLARRADARWRKEAEGFAELVELQGRLLRAAASVVRPGGVLVYSVCSFEPEETDEVVASFLAGNPEWKKENAASYLPAALVEEGGSMRILPHHHGTDGAFAVRLVREGSAG